MAIPINNQFIPSLVSQASKILDSAVFVSKLSPSKESKKAIEQDIRRRVSEFLLSNDQDQHFLEAGIRVKTENEKQEGKGSKIALIKEAKMIALNTSQLKKNIESFGKFCKNKLKSVPNITNEIKEKFQKFILTAGSSEEAVNIQELKAGGELYSGDLKIALEEKRASRINQQKLLIRNLFESVDDDRKPLPMNNGVNPSYPELY